jgi:hypothetical protein
MKIKNAVLSVAATAAVAAATVGVTASSASAAWGFPVDLITPHTVGLYSLPYSWFSKVGPDLPGQQGNVVYVQCYTTGEDIANQGDVWYRVNGYRLNGTDHYLSGYGWTYAPYVDGNEAYDLGYLDHC